MAPQSDDESLQQAPAVKPATQRASGGAHRASDFDAPFLEAPVPLGGEANGSLVVSQSFSGYDISAPVTVWRGREPGPTVCLQAAVHGDEINGAGAILQILRDRPFELRAGTLILVPVVNLIGFERNARYMPDRRDLNRSFPGSVGGTLTGRLAHAYFTQVIERCDYCIDLHTAAVRRTNFPNVRANLSIDRLAAFARAFGAELTINGDGPQGSLRSEACKAGCATLILEAGEVWKTEPTVVEYAIRGVTNCLRFLGMVAGKPIEPPYRLETDATKWIRAEHGGFLSFHVAPGQIVSAGEPIATAHSLHGDDLGVIAAPREGIILGMTTIPSVSPGDPVCHLAFPSEGSLAKVERAVNRLRVSSLHERVRDDLARSVNVTEHNESDPMA
ncbi:Succinylglutamate desuccinylase / Aspartoacylase family protein [Pseudobythopirellula maris]|uniref:Succinylglutamate desuccinylase / Aspartoacylase family protein n=1 Tax=Pseudobythopirellula maris TaxID=2527991 RepID=A0A5C5ZVT2_9BACT|nr:succinylglutamate desuccinylase/aspartoacylase family protein [Pseudobythopirellula maris]TWT90343.1 Succinylglutamate desuccinylase / Aspartoacylase family protein [Pseudobythopirellula maris]